MWSSLSCDRQILGNVSRLKAKRTTGVTRGYLENYLSFFNPVRLRFQVELFIFFKKKLALKKQIVLTQSVSLSGRLAQLVRATGLHPVGRRFESYTVYHSKLEIFPRYFIQSKKGVALSVDEACYYLVLLPVLWKQKGMVFD